MPRQAASVARPSTALSVAALVAGFVLVGPRGARAVTDETDEEAARAFILRLGERTFEILRQPGRTRQSVESAFRARVSRPSQLPLEALDAQSGW